MKIPEKIVPAIVASLGLFAAGISWGAYATQVQQSEGVTISSNPATTDTGLHERLDPAGTSAAAYDSEVNCRRTINRNLPDCAAYWPADSKDYVTLPEGASVDETYIQRGGHIVRHTAVSER